MKKPIQHVKAITCKNATINHFITHYPQIVMNKPASINIAPKEW